MSRELGAHHAMNAPCEGARERAGKRQALIFAFAGALACGRAENGDDETEIEPLDNFPVDAVGEPVDSAPPTGNWECVGGNEDPVRIPAGLDGVLFSIRVLDSVTGAAIPNLSVQICEVSDRDCRQPLAPSSASSALLVVAGTEDSSAGVTASLNYETQVFL